jgi:hypothetical protein
MGGGVENGQVLKTPNMHLDAVEFGFDRVLQTEDLS